MFGLHPARGLTPRRAVAPAPDLAFSPDGARLATETQFGQVTVWDLSTTPPRAEQVWSTVLGFLVPSVAFSPDGSRVAARTDEGVQVWWALTGQPALNIVGHANQVVDAAFDPTAVG